MLEVVKAVALACVVSPGGHGVDSNFSPAASSQDSAHIALRLQLTCQSKMLRCLGNEAPLFSKWVDCIEQTQKELPK